MGQFFCNQHTAGIGALLRDEKGEVLFVSSKELPVNDQIEIELVAILRGLQLCLHRSIPKLEVQTDSLLLVTGIQDLALFSNSYLGNVLRDVKELMMHF